MKRIYLLILCILSLACTSEHPAEDPTIEEIAENYVRLGLDVGRYDADFVDAYYGPDSLNPIHPKLDQFPKDSILDEITVLQGQLNRLDQKSENIKARAVWLNAQLTAFSRRVKIFSGELSSFDLESEELFGVQAPVYNAAHYQNLLDSLDKILPGTGTVQDRFQLLANRFIIPKGSIDTVFREAISESRRRTKTHYSLPTEENFNLEYVTNKPWSGYNWYKGNYSSTIQINTDTDIFIDRAIDVASHESYPGHHVYNMMLEKNLFRDKGWVEISLYPLFSPQSFIAEGSANYGIELAFPGNEKIRYASEKLLPLAGIDTTGLMLYFNALNIKGKLNYARNEAARGLVDKTMTEQEAIAWLENYCLYNRETAQKSVAFIRKYRSYVINYNYGKDLVQRYVDASTEDLNSRWERFETLLSNPMLPTDLSPLKK